MDRFVTVVFSLYALVVVIAAVPYGLVDAIPLAVITAVMSVILIAAVFVFGLPRGGRHVFIVTLAMLALLAGWIVFQAHGFGPPFPPGSVWQGAQEIVGAGRGSISVQPADTRNALIYLALPGMTFLAGLMVADTDARALALLRILAVGGGLIAVFGLMQFLLSPHMLLAAEKRFYVGSLTAVYVNRNTAATHLGLVLLMLLTFAIHSGRFRESEGPGRDGGGVGRLATVIYGGLALSAFLALMLTQSRAGIAATAVVALFYLPLISTHWFRRMGFGGGGERSLSQRLVHLAPPIAVAVLVLLLVAFSAGRVMFRANVRGLDDNRFCFWPDVLTMIGDHWLMGTGFGTFRTAFSAYRDPSCGIDGIFDRAHNSYLEGFATLGIVFPVTLAVFISLILWSFRHGYRERKRLRLIAALGLAGTLLVALHAMVDFSLQIPGFAVAYAAFLAATVSICHGRDRKAGTERRERPSGGQGTTARRRSAQ